MTIGLYWWRPLRSPRSLAGELIRRGNAWIRMIASRPRVCNFGDEFSGIAIAELAGKRVRWRSPGSADVFGIGSILGVYGRQHSSAMVFGSGLRAAPAGRPGVDADRVLAIRGHLTRVELGLPDSTVTGDPGLAVGHLDLGPRRRKSAPLLIPHFAALNSPAARSMVSGMRANGYDVALPNQSPLAIAAKIRNASFVATSSLHGLVFAHALGTAAALVTFPGLRHSEPRFKYDDYLSVFDETSQFTPIGDVADPARARRLADRLGERTTLLQDASSRVVDGLRKAASAL